MMQNSKKVAKYLTRCGCRSVSNQFQNTAKQKLKKAMPAEMMKAYNPKPVETGWYEWWQSEEHYFSNKINDKRPVFSMLLPPPNVTGTLHLGHALTCSVQDVLARWRRMHGDQVVWLPGTDHAGIATQVVVEKHLARQGLGSRHNLGREKFIQEVWKWREEKGDTICDQLKHLGASLDWSRQYFTLDKHQSNAVKEAFVNLYEAGLVYRAKALVSWSCALRSAIADIEVDWKELNGVTQLTVPGYDKPVPFGQLTKVALPLSAGDGELVVATTRVETMLGDVAVAVHPEDQRYSFLIGQQVKHPLRTNVSIPVIADDFVDPDFGTGAVKITPAHDIADWEVAKRHNLKFMSVITEEGLMAQNCGAFAGMKRFDARQAIMHRLAELGVLRGNEPLTSGRVPVCSRSGDIIEMLLKPQWFINCGSMAEQAKNAVVSGQLIIDPPAFHKVWFDWLGNIRDWCVSRQLWWGHQVPAYLCTSCIDNSQTWVAARSEDEARVKAEKHFSTNQITIQQDSDVLDTWFSSALLPFSTLGWPNKNALQQQSLYPLNVMETGHDILFFWVARMVMLATQLTGKLPFKKILLHGIICDSDGRKMSKSLGNVIHPEDVIDGTSLQQLKERTRQSFKQSGTASEELPRALAAQQSSFPEGVPECGTDALRFTLCSHNLKSHNVTFDIIECHTNRLFCNKIWQATKFVLSAVSQVGSSDLCVPASQPIRLCDQWILSRLAVAVQQVEEALKETDLHEATAAIKNFIYKEFCDVYLECSKVYLKDPSSSLETTRVLLTCLVTSLKLLAPFMPYITEELYQYLPSQQKKYETVHLETFPSNHEWQERINNKAERDMELILKIVESARRLKNIHQIKKIQANVVLEVSGREVQQSYEENKQMMKALMSCSDIQICDEGKVKVPSTSEVVSPNCILHLCGEHKTGKPSQRKEKLKLEINKLEAITNAPGYKQKAAENVQQNHRDKLARLHAELLKISAQRKNA